MNLLNNKEVNNLENKLITFKKRINEKNEKNEKENENEDHSDEHLYEIHNLEKELLDFIQEMSTKVQMNGRWCSIAKTHFQEGCMALIRSTTEK
jgi:hypothetical protein